MIMVWPKNFEMGQSLESRDFFPSWAGHSQPKIPLMRLPTRTEGVRCCPRSPSPHSPPSPPSPHSLLPARWCRIGRSQSLRRHDRAEGKQVPQSKDREEGGARQHPVVYVVVTHDEHAVSFRR